MEETVPPVFPASKHFFCKKRSLSFLDLKEILEAFPIVYRGSQGSLASVLPSSLRNTSLVHQRPLFDLEMQSFSYQLLLPYVNQLVP